MLFVSFYCPAEDTISVRKIENLKTFAKLYGYIRYFHPSDEAAYIDWEKFAAYGCKKVENITATQDLIITLRALFSPLAPGIQIFSINEKVDFDVRSITPYNLKGYDEIYWQHNGLGAENPQSIYKSVRVNSTQAFQRLKDYASIYKSLDVSKYQGKEFCFKAFVKTEGDTKGYLWARVDKTNGTKGFFDNMNDRPIISAEWQEYKITGRFDRDADLIYFGAYLLENKNIYIDDMCLSVKNDTGWTELYNKDFEKGIPLTLPYDLQTGIGNGAAGGAAHSFIVNNDSYKGKCCLLLTSSEKTIEVNKVSKPLFQFKPAFGEYISKEIGSGIKCHIPLCLYGNKNGTYPATDLSSLNELKSLLSQTNVFTAEDLHTRLAIVMITYNTMQHFYPYFDVVKTNWSEAFTNALIECYQNTSEKGLELVLKKLTAQLHDGHVSIVAPKSDEIYYPPFKCEIIQEQLVITKTLSDSIELPLGTIITKINGIFSAEFLASKKIEISAATKGWMNYRLGYEALKGNEKVLNLSVLKPDGITSEVSVKRTLSGADYYNRIENKTQAKLISQGIIYLNLDQITMDEIEDLMDKLAKATTIICDLRGYPNSNHKFIQYLLSKDDTSSSWMQVPQIIYPDYNVSGFDKKGWKLKTLKPHLKAKIIFIIDGSAISYSESFMGFIEEYKLATIVGEPTAGSNGNVNIVNLPAGFSFRFTGMKVVRHNGGQQHGIGILPNVPVFKTIKGVTEGRDEFLEKAIDLAK